MTLFRTTTPPARETVEREKLTNLQADLAVAERERDAALAEVNAAGDGDIDRSRLIDARRKVATLYKQCDAQRSVADRAAFDARCQRATAKRPEYEAVVRRMAAAVRELRKCAADEIAFRDQLAAADASAPHVVYPVGFPDGTATLDRWLAEAQEHYAV
jgi:hypothetical protein